MRRPLQEIDEVPSLETVFQSAHAVGRSAWVVLDIDHTLLRSAEYFGSEPWYERRIEHHIEQGREEAHAILDANDDWERASLQVAWVPVEASAPRWVRGWQEARYPLFGLTCRAGNHAPHTHRQLTTAGFDLSATAHTLAEEWRGGGSYAHGILFLGPLGEKGPVLREFALSAPEPPTHVFFVDDKMAHVHSVRRELENTGIVCTAVRLSCMDDSPKKLYGMPG